METVRILSADDGFVTAMTNAFLRNRRYEVMPAPKGGMELLELLLRDRTDVLLVDLALPEVDGMDVLDVVSAMPLPVRPLLFAVVDLCTPRMVELMEDKLTYCFVKPVDADRIVVQVTAMTVMRQPLDHRMRMGYALLDRLVTECLFSLGVSPHLNGYHLLRAAVMLVACVRLPSRLSVMQHIYPAVATLCHTTVSMTEHAMRHAIESAWMRADIDALQRYFGYTVHEMRDTPSNSAFIFMLADRVRMGMAGVSYAAALPSDDAADQQRYA